MASTMRFDNWQTTDGTSIATTNASGDITFAGAVAGAGKILQVVRATDGTDRSTTSTSFVDASISVTITPTSATSDILLVWSFRHGGVTLSGANTRSIFQITDSSNVAIPGAEEAWTGPAGGSGVGAFYSHLTIVGYDSPATTSATTYKGRFAKASTNDSVTVNILNGSNTLNNSNTGQLFALEISA